MGDLHLELALHHYYHYHYLHLELALHHRALADGGNVDWVLARAGRVIPYFHHLFYLFKFMLIRLALWMLLKHHQMF